MTEPRQVHNPGTVLLVPVTADGMRYLYNACVQIAKVNRIQGMALENEASHTGGVTRQDALLKLRELHRHLASQYESLGREINAAKNETPPSEMSLMSYGEQKLTVVGLGVYDPRLQAWKDDLAELGRRTAEVRDLRKGK